MPKITDTYRYYALTELRDVWYPGYDERNMITTENQFSALYQFVGPGILSGWEVTMMPSALRGDTIGATELSERNSLINAEPGTYLSKVYDLIGNPSLMDELAWGQIIKTSTGKGVVGVFAAETVQDAYFRFSVPDSIFYVWAESGLCLSSDGRCHITVPADGLYEHNERATATYLATVEVTESQVYPGEAFVLSVSYDERRKSLKNLDGALQEALDLSFYRHVHLGGFDNPSKIQLSTSVIFDTINVPGSTIFSITVPNEYLVKWNNGGFGIPIVKLDGVVLSSSNYTIDYPGKRIFLKNSISSGSQIKIVLPLYEQVLLDLHEDSLISDSIQGLNPDRLKPIYLTNGLTETDSNGQESQIIFTWDGDLYRDAQVFLDGVLVNANLYQVTPSDGSINFNPALDGNIYTSQSLSVVLTKLGQEIENTISGNQLENLDASTVKRGTLSQNRIKQLDHVGLVRYQEVARIQPTKRLFQLGDGYRYYSEVLSDLQHTTEIYHVHQTVNVNESPYLMSTKRGVLQTSDLSMGTLLSSWNPDRGRAKKILDNLLQDGSQLNYFKEIYLLTQPGRNTLGKVYVSTNQAASWNTIRMPIDGNVVSGALDFYASTEKVQNVTNSGLVVFEYSTLYYLATNRGLWTANIPEGTSSSDWVWTQADYAEDTVYTIQEICTKNISYNADGSSVESQDRTLYVGSDEGFFINGQRLNTSEVKGFYWPRSGSALNQLFWWTDDAVYLSHSGNRVTETYPDGGGIDKWNHPLSNIGTVLYSVAVATTSPISLLSITSVDGYTLISGDRVLVKNQVDTTTNGVYTFDGVNLNLISGSQLNTVRVEVSGGGSLDGSGWICNVSGLDISYNNLWYRLIQNNGNQFTSVTLQANTTNTFYAFSKLGTNRCNKILLTYEDDVLETPVVTLSSWSNAEQDSPIYSWSIGGDVYTGSKRGLWRSNDDCVTWTRNSQQFTQFDSITIYDSNTLTRVSDADFLADANTQGITFASQQNLWDAYVYERVYTDYYINPWNSVNADVVVYINDSVSQIPYTLFPLDGKISFSTTLSPEDVVKVTIIRAGAYISNVASTPHEELFNATVSGLTALTQLSAELTGSAIAGTEIILKDREKIPVSAVLLELRYRSFQERVGVIVDPDDNRVYLANNRQGTNVFPADFTEVYLVEIKNVLGIEDIISQGTSNQTYHMNSLIGVNTLQMSMTAEEKDSNFYNNFSRPPGGGFSADRGPKSSYFFNSLTDNFDELGSSSTIASKLEPSEIDIPYNPRTVYTTNNITQSGAGMRIGTDKGVWIYENNRWKKESPLNNANRVYFIKNRNDVLTIGANNGLWERINATWVNNTLYPQSIFAHESGDWFDGTFEAFGKNDGLAFTWTVGSEAFTSDPFIPVAETKVYGLWKNKFIRLQENGTQEEVDALYLCTENGLFGVTNGTTSGTYSAFLAGREMFGDSPLEVSYTNPDGNVIQIPVKIYKIFKGLARPVCDDSTPKEPIPIHVLTNNGVYKIRNWRWCDPANTSGLDFYPENHNLKGITCNCYALTTRACSPGVEPLSKIFIGTDYGVYRSYNDGTTYDKCERINNDNIAVYDLTFDGECLIASTESGIFYSDDDGDTWHKPNPDDVNACLQTSPTISISEAFEGQYIAQTFKPVTGQTSVVRVAAYLSVEYPETHDNLSALLDNYLRFTIWSTDGNGVPLSILDTANVDIVASEVLYPNFWSAEFTMTLPDSTSTYALVAEEVPDAGAGGTKVFRWHKTALDNPYTYGKAYQYDGTWVPVPGYDSANADLFFRVYFSPAPEAVEETINLNLVEGEGYGFICTDSGALTTDFKVAASFVLDDSQSMDWCDPDDGLGEGSRGSALVNLMNVIWERTKYIDINALEYYPSWGSVYTFGTSIIDRTNGYTNNPSQLSIYLNGLFERGNQSTLNEASRLATTTLFPQAIFESIMDAENWSDLVAEVVEYLNDSNKALLRLNDIVDWFESQPVGTRSDWPYDDPDDSVKIATIKDYEDVSEYVIRRWANTFRPIIVVVGDGDDTGSQSALNVATSALSGWPVNGTQIVTLGTDTSQRQVDLKTMSDESGGFYAPIIRGESGGDWSSITNTLVHEGENTIFSNTWSKTIEFDEATWVRNIQSSFSSDPGSECVVKYRFTQDRANWSSWTTLANATNSTIDSLVYGIEFSVFMLDGWDDINERAIRPQLNNITYTKVTPGRKYFVTEAENINGMLFEYLLSPVINVPRTSSLNWGIARGNSTDFADFESVRTNRKGCLPNRQQSIQFSEKIVQLLLNTSTINNVAYQVIASTGEPTSWLPDDVIQVYIGGIEVRNDESNPYYTYDYALGIVYFRDEQPAGTQVRVTITTPQKLYIYDGEPTLTTDNRVYRAVNGRWPYDASVVVLVNGNIQRGGYWTSPEEGLVVFLKEREVADIVTVYIQHSGIFRIGCEVMNYSTTDIDIEKFGLYYTQKQNRTIIFSYQNPEPPAVTDGTLVLSPGENATAYTRLTIGYEFTSPENAKERQTTTSWWRYRPGEDTGVYSEVDANDFVRISAINGFIGDENYDNRTVQRTIDVGTLDLFKDGDRWYVKVIPYDGFSYGTEQDSLPSIMLGDNSPPWITVANVTSPQKNTIDGKAYVPAGATVSAQYVFEDIDGVIDQSIVNWYNQDSNVILHTGVILPSELVTTGKVLSFVVNPYDGQNYGTSVRSDEVTVL
jgi:hypothetical protein